MGPLSSRRSASSGNGVSRRPPNMDLVAQAPGRQSRTTDKGGASKLIDGRKLTTPQLKKKIGVLQNVTQGL
jgi:hypothetical protein